MLIKSQALFLYITLQRVKNTVLTFANITAHIACLAQCLTVHLPEQRTSFAHLRELIIYCIIILASKLTYIVDWELVWCALLALSSRLIVDWTLITYVSTVRAILLLPWMAQTEFTRAWHNIQIWSDALFIRHLHAYTVFKYVISFTLIARKIC